MLFSYLIENDIGERRDLLPDELGERAIIVDGIRDVMIGYRVGRRDQNDAVDFGFGRGGLPQYENARFRRIERTMTECRHPRQ
jgi:hypothetical protein